MSEENRSPVHQAKKVVELRGGPPWGFRIQGGKDSSIPLKVARVNPGSKAAKSGIRDGDLIYSINGQPTEELTNVEVQRIIKKSGDRVTFELRGATKRMGATEGSSSLSANDQQAAASTSLSTSQLSSSSGPAVPSTTSSSSVAGAADESNNALPPNASSTPSGSQGVTTTTTTAGAGAASSSSTKAEKKEKKKSEKSKKKSGQSPSKSADDLTKEKKKSGKHHQQQQQPQQDSVDKVTLLSADDGDGEANVAGGGVGANKTNKHVVLVSPKSTLKKSGNDSPGKNGKHPQHHQQPQKQSLKSAAAAPSSSSAKKGNGKITGASSSLLGDIIAELDDLLDADFFNAPHLTFSETNNITSPPDSDNFRTSKEREEEEEGQLGENSGSQQLLTGEKKQPPPPVNNVAGISCSDLPNLEESSSIPAVWTPPSAPSPSSQKKFRPVNFNVPGSPKSSTPRTLSLDRSNSSPQLPTRIPQPQTQSQQSRQLPPLQTSASLTDQSLLSHHQQKEIVSSPEQNDNSSRSDSIYQTSSGSISVTQTQNSSSQSTVSLPKYQSPTVTLLKKAREGQLPKGAHYLEQQNFSPSKSSPVHQQQHQQLQQQRIPEPVSRTVAGLTLDLEGREVGKRVTERGVEFEGIGPTTPEGVPIATKPAIQRDQQHQWYKRMYESLHVERPQRRGPRQLHGGQSAGHYSEPEGYESDTYAYKYATLDRRKLRDRYSESTDCFSPSPSTPNSILSPTSSCPPSGIRFTPGRIEDYTPGNSCVIAKEIRKHKPTLQWALGSRDLGYESDSNLIIRRRNEEEAEFRGIKSPPPPPLSPAESRQIYVEIQKGGEVPLQGLRKPAPERPKESSWLNLLRLKVRSMPSFEEMRKSIPFGRGRSISPINYRSGSPVCKSPPPNSTVALLQERIQEKIRRSNSDLSPRPSASFRSRYGLSGIDASRIVHTIRSTNQIRRSGSSYIPIRSRETSVEKLRVSSPELVSPREVKKAMQSSHRLSIKLEVVKSSPNGKKGGVASGEGKKSGLRKNGNGKSNKGSSSTTTAATSTKGKSVKISDKVSVENDHHHHRSSTIKGTTTNGSSNIIPVKPPRKLKTKLGDTSSSSLSSSAESAGGKGGLGVGGKVQRLSKVSPAASRHASCLSPHASRPTSPGGGLSSAISISNTSLNNNLSVNGKSGSSAEKIMGSSGKIVSATSMSPSTPVDSSGRQSSGIRRGRTSGAAAAESSTATSTKLCSGRKLIRDGGGKQGSGTNRISLSSGKDDRKSPEKEEEEEEQLPAPPPPLPPPASTTKTSKITTSNSGVKSKERGSSMPGDVRKLKYNTSIRETVEDEIERVFRVHEEREIMEHEIKSNSNIDLREETFATSKERMRGDGNRSSSISNRIRETMRYWTIPPRKKGRDASASPSRGATTTTTTSTSLERPMSLFAFRSLPALTPYLTETKRVSQSLFLAKQQSSQQFPIVRPTKTSALREKLAHDPPETFSSPPTTGRTGRVGSDSTTTPKTIKRGRIIRSVSCLTLKEKLIRDYTYTNYILELQHARKRSPRFLQLHKLYSSLERLGQLERSTSLYDIPVLSAEKQLDFEAWWKVRNRLRVEEEMSSILNQLMHAQRNREFFFRPKSPEAIKWKGDSSLRIKKWNIDELRHFLLTGELNSKHTSTSDLHKTAWRGTSVKEVALNMEVASLSKADYYYYRDKELEYNRMPALRRAFSMSSTLSEDQKEKIKSRLGTLIIKRENKDKDNAEHSSTDKRKGRGGGVGNDVPGTVRTSRMGLTPIAASKTVPDGDHQVVGVDGSLTETAKRQLSKTISEEVQERKQKERESIRIVEGSASGHNNYSSSGTSNINGNAKLSGGESESSESSMKTVIHIPVSTKMLLRKCHEQQNQSNLAKGKTPVYSVYCTKGVPSKVNFFETFHKDSNNNKEPIMISPSEAKIVKTKVYSEKLNKGGGRANEQKIGSSVSFVEEQNNRSKSSNAPPPSAAKIDSPVKAVVAPKEKKSSSSPQDKKSSSPRKEKSGKRSRSVTPEKKLTYDNRYMSHINVISKLASLLLKKDHSLKDLVRREVLERDRLERLRMVNAGEVDRLRHYFEDYVSGGEYDSTFLPEVSLLRCLFCSDPNLARLTEKFHLGSSNNTVHARRCASADIFKEKLDYFEGRDRDRIRPDGKESSPVHSPELYFSSRSRRPIYQPSSTPNICQPTLTAHCFLESPTKSMEFDASCYSSDFSGNYWDYHSTSPVPSSATIPPGPYSPLHTRTPATATAAAAGTNPPISLSSDHSNPKLNREMSYSSVPPRILDSRVAPPCATSTPINSPPQVNKNPNLTTGSTGQELGKNWNFDPALHQPKYRYVPQPPQYYSTSGNYPRTNIVQQHGSLPPVLNHPPPPIPPPPANYQHHHQQQPGRLMKSESFHAPPSSHQSHFAPHLYRSVRYWNANARGESSTSGPEYHRPGPNVGLPLQRSASLNYGHHHQQQQQQQQHQRTTSVSSAKPLSNGRVGQVEQAQLSSSTKEQGSSTDIESQIRLIETQFNSNDNQGSVNSPSNNNIGSNDNSGRDVISIPVPVLSNTSSSAGTNTNTNANANAAATRRTLQLENASQSPPVKYAESEVNIHYKAPVRFEEKEFIGEDELRRRQEIAMRRFYEEQRHRKFLQEIQDMENRRHMDNFTPSQKSPIPLNRYDDVIDELPKARWREKTPESKLAARALYNFAAQNSRELSFRKGDILFIRRKVDSNWYEGEHNAAVGIFPVSYVETLPSYDIERATPRTMSEGQAKVRFNFTAATPAEMSIIKGETVVLTRRVDQNWYEGRIGSRRGIFPASYVQVLREPGQMDYLSNSSSAKSPKPIGAPAAHSLVTQNGGSGGMYNTAKHSYRPNEYSLGTDLSNIDAFINAQSPLSPSSGHLNNNQYRKEHIFNQQQQQQQFHHHHHLNSVPRSQNDPGRNRYAQNLTIDTRIEPIPYRAVYNYKPAHEDELELREQDVIHVLEKCDDGWFVGTSQRTGLFGTFPGNYVERIY